MRLRDYFQHYQQSLSACLNAAMATDAQGTTLDLHVALEDMIAVFRNAHQQGGKLIFVGNGGSAAIASHQAYDYWKNGGLRAMSLNDPAMLTGSANDFGYHDVFAKPISLFAIPQDVVIAISSSGQSPNILRAAEQGRSIGCRVMTLSAFKPDNPLRRSGDVNVYLQTDVYGHAEIGHVTILHTMLDHTIFGEKM